MKTFFQRDQTWLGEIHVFMSIYRAKNSRSVIWCTWYMLEPVLEDISLELSVKRHNLRSMGAREERVCLGMIAAHKYSNLGSYSGLLSIIIDLKKREAGGRWGWRHAKRGREREREHLPWRLQAPLQRPRPPRTPTPFPRFKIKPASRTLALLHISHIKIPFSNNQWKRTS